MNNELHRTDETIKHPYDWNAKLVRYFLNNSRLVWLIIAAIIIGGLFALLNFQRQGFPQVSPKVALVQTIYPGATADEMERQVTGLIEAAVKDVKGLKETSSTSANSFSNVVVTLDESVNLDTAVQDIQSKVQSIQADLPADAEPPKVQTFATSGPAFIFGVTHESGDMDTIRHSADDLIQGLSDVEGVKTASLANEAPERIVITFDPAKMAVQGAQLQILQLALQGANVNFPAGTLDLEGKTQSVISVGAFTTLDEISNLIVGVNPRTRQPIRVQDIAEVRRGFASDVNIDRFGSIDNGQLVSHPGVLVNVEVTAEADVIKTKKAIDEHLAVMETDGELDGVTVAELSNVARDTQDQIGEIVDGAIGTEKNVYMLGGIQLLFIAMLLFVNWRAAIVAALAIPLSMLFTFASLAITGTELNTIVLFSLILVLGLIVDPAIIMIESIQRYRDLKYGAVDAVLESGRRYGASLFMAVLASMIVFAPFGVVSGIFGEIIKYIPLTVLPALIASYIIPIAILPMLSKWLMKSRSTKAGETAMSGEDEGLWRIARWFMSVSGTLLAKRWRQVVTLVVALLLVAGSLAIVGMGKVQIVQFSKAKDNPYLTIDARFPKGLTFADRSAVGAELEQLLLNESGVAKYFYYQQSRDGLYLFAELKIKADRDETQTSKEIVRRLRASAKDITHLDDIIINELGTGTPEPDYQIQVQLNDNDPAVLETAAKEVGDYLRSLEHITRVDDGFTGKDESEVRVILDRMRVQVAGLSSYEIGQQLKAVIGETTVTKYTGEGGSADVILKNGALPADLDAIRNLPLVSQAGQVVRVSDVATVEESSTAGVIQRFDGLRYVSVRARIDDSKNLVAVQQKFNEYLTDEKLDQLGIDSRDSRGEFDDIAKSFQELGMALAAAILMTYIFLALQFKSFTQPLVMLITVPLSLTGVFPALLLTGSDLGFLELLGVTILVGIVVSVGIFLMDYANQLVKERGYSAKDAIIQATGVRFRPIVLTKLVVIGGLLPLAFESEFWRGLAVAIIGGIALSGFLSLIVLPILYVWIQAGRDRLHGKGNHTIG
ncbi:MAG: efflux RND transporter permease subunit [Candidatus Kerfeldbacteria bacterium]|nr:efflux RND transporter permease subunit [Candidatus Kerfeldbacteria bacterium]